jgi:hypothetical protein
VAALPRRSRAIAADQEGQLTWRQLHSGGGLRAHRQGLKKQLREQQGGLKGIDHQLADSRRGAGPRRGPIGEPVEGVNGCQAFTLQYRMCKDGADYLPLSDRLIRVTMSSHRRSSFAG